MTTQFQPAPHLGLSYRPCALLVGECNNNKMQLCIVDDLPQRPPFKVLYIQGQ